MILLFAILIITICSLLHDSDGLPKRTIIAIHFVALSLLLASWVGFIAAAASVGLFWGVFRRGWQAKAELTAITTRTPEAIRDIINSYPLYLGYVPAYITQLVLKLPLGAWYRRVQSGLIALLWTGPISALPAIVIKII